MGKASRDKGKRGEREIAALFRAHGFQARRGRQYKGGPDSPDIEHDILGLHVEVKFREHMSVFAALAWASRDAGFEGDSPVVFMRKLRKPWIVVMAADDFLEIMEEIRDFKKQVDGCHGF